MIYVTQNLSTVWNKEEWFGPTAEEQDGKLREKNEVASKIL